MVDHLLPDLLFARTIADLAEEDPSTAALLTARMGSLERRGLAGFFQDRYILMIETLWEIDPPIEGDTPVRVFHNIAQYTVSGYSPGDPLVEVASWGTGSTAPHSNVLTETYRLLNVGEDPAFGEPDRRALTYRLRFNRSLNIGDVVRIGDSHYACTRLGWTAIVEPELVVSITTVHGSTPKGQPA